MTAELRSITDMEVLILTVKVPHTQPPLQYNNPLPGYQDHVQCLLLKMNTSSN